MRIVAAVLCGALACFTLSGCFWFNYGRFDPFQKGDAFDESRKRFTRMIRWGQIDRAAEYVVAEERAAFFEAAESLRGVRFTDYEVLSVQVERLRNATVHVMFRGYPMNSPVERTVAMKQEWERSGDGWRVRPEIAPLRKAFQ